MGQVWSCRSILDRSAKTHAELLGDGQLTESRAVVQSAVAERDVEVLQQAVGMPWNPLQRVIEQK